jgi:hypothetical protein
VGIILRIKVNAKDIAINFIRPYVLRGDSLESLIAGSGGQYSKDYHVEIGGYVWDKTIKNLLYKAKRDEVVVSQINGEDCLFIYKIYKLYDEIRSGQLKLL